MPGVLWKGLSASLFQKLREMGVITDGSISGNLPDAKAFAVNYPGYPSSTSRAIETLGGIDGILETRSSLTNKLKLCFRPEDPYSHPTFGKLRPCSGLLLRISKKKSTDDKYAAFTENNQKNSSTAILNSELKPCFPESCKDGQETQTATVNDVKDAQLHEEASSFTQLCANIVARVPQEYHFDGMADYQYVLAVHVDVARSNWKHPLDDLMCPGPPLFSLKDKPEDLALEEYKPKSKRKQVSVVQDQWEMDIELCFAIDFNIEEIPKKINWEDKIPQGSAPWEWQMVMSKLFDERPIWPRRSVHDRLLAYGLKATDGDMRRLLLRNAYYFSAGPFGRFWIKKGYDPRKDPESRLYQRVDFRLPSQLRTFGVMNKVDGSKHTWKDICEFRAFPSQSSMCLQFFELADDYIQEEIRKPAEQTTCTRLIGWFSKNMFESLKLRISMRFLSICPQVGAKDLLKSVSKCFERSKRLQIHGRNSRPDVQDHRHVNRGPNNFSADGLETRSNNKEIACDDDNDEAEDEEEEEDGYEEYGLPLGDGGDGICYSEPSTYPVGENIANSYLQQLFGSLPFTTDGNYSNAQDADMSDGEYQIYEQDSSGDSDNYNDNKDDGF